MISQNVESIVSPSKLITNSSKRPFSSEILIIICPESDTSPHYRNGDEPEPVDLTFLNIEAAMMYLASKVRTICGKADSPTLSNRTMRRAICQAKYNM